MQCNAENACRKCVWKYVRTPSEVFLKRKLFNLILNFFTLMCLKKKVLINGSLGAKYLFTNLESSRVKQSKQTKNKSFSYLNSFFQLTFYQKFTPGVHNSNLMAGQKKFFDTSKGQNCYVLTHSKGFYIKERSKKQNLGFRSPD